MAALAVPGGFAFGAQRPAIQQEGPQVNCISQKQTPNIIRNEGQTEQIADYYFSCYNYGENTTATVSATISPAVAITSRTLDGPVTEATLVIQDAAGFQAQQTILGTVSGNIVTFSDFTLPHSSNTSAYQPFNLTVTNIRVDATSLTTGTILTEMVSVTGPTATPATFDAVQIAQVQPGIGPQSVFGKVNFPVCKTVTAAAAAFTVQFAENSLLLNAFKTLGGGDGNAPVGAWASNNTETGFAVNTKTGLGNTANSGTRLRILFSNIPSNINLYVPVSVRSANGATLRTPAGTVGLTATEAGAYAPVSGTTSITGYTGTADLAQLTVVNGSAEAVYEVLTDSATIAELYQIPVYLASGGTVATQGAITAAVSFAPVGASSNIPDFAQLASTTALSGSQFPTCETITNSTLSGAVAGAAYSQAVSVTGGITPYTWSLPGTNMLPAGLLLNSSTGAITGAPTTPGPYSFTIKVADSGGQTKTQLYSLTVYTALVIANTTLSNGVVGTGYSQAVGATGGATPYTWSLPTGNTLPGGLLLNASTGAITGTPTTAGPNSFTVQVADSSGQIKTQPYSVTVNAALVITNTTLPSGVLTVAYSQAVAVTGGATPYTWSLPTGNTLPAGLLLNTSTGAITGTPTAAGPNSFTVQVADSSGQIKTQLYSLAVNTPLVITNTTLPNGVLTVGYSQAVAVTGGATPYTWSLPTGNTLPAGLALNASTGAITGTPTTAGLNSFTVQVADSAAQVKTQPYSLTVNTALVISNTTLPAGVLTLSYSQAVAVTGGLTPYTWSLPMGNTLPSGLALNASTGAITGTPNAVGPFSFTIKVADTSGQTRTQLYNFTVDAAVTTTFAFRVPDATVGETYSTTLTATGGYGVYTWSLTGSESLLTGLTLSPGGVFRGTPTASGFYTSLTATVTDSSGATANNPINILINTALKITTTSLPVGVVGTAYPVTPAVPSGGSGGNVWSLALGSLTGTGLSFSPQGVFSGTPLAAGPIGLTLKLTDQGGASATQPVTITVNPPLAIPTTTPLNTGVQGVFYSQQLPSTGGTGVNQWLLSDRGTLPSGITLGSSGVLSGLPGVNGTFTFTARVTDSYNDVVNQPLTWQVNPPVSFVTGATLPGTINGTSYAATLAATGGLGNYTFTPTTVIPFPLTFNNETGALSGSTNTAGTLTFSVKVTDSSGSNATQQFTILVTPSIYLNFASIVDGLLPLGYFRLETLSGTSEVNGYTYTASSTGATVAQGVPNGITFNDSVKLDGASGDVTTSLIGGVNTAGSIMAWVQMSALPSVLNQIEYVAGESQTGNDFDLQFTTDNVLRFYSTSSNQNLSYTPALSNLLNQWHMIVATFDNTAGRRVLYWDGQPVASDTVQSLTNKMGPFEIGNSSVFGGRYFDGAIDEVGVWSFALSPSQIAQIYEEPNERLPNGLTTQTYGPFTIAAAGGSGSYTYTATGVPSGLTLSSAGVLTGQPTAAVNSAFLTVKATDTVTSQTSSLGFLISVSSPVIVTPAILSAAVVNVSYSKTLTATGGLGSGYHFTLANGSTLPAGMSLSLAGVLSGTPQVSGMTSFTVVATDSNGSSGQQSFPLTVYPAVTFTTSSTLTPAPVGVAYNQIVAATGGLGSYTFSVANGSSLPNWLSLNTSTGALTGTPTGPAPYSFSLNVLDSSGSAATQTFSLTAYAPLTVAPPTLPIGVQNVYYSRTLAASGGIRGYTFSLAEGSGTLPAGLQISSGGTISGVPTASGPSTFTVMVTDSASNVATQQYTLQINAALTISMTTLPVATQGAAYNQMLGATGGVGNYTWSIGLGTFTNAGLALNASTGALTGTPVTADTLTFGVQVSDGAGDTAFQTFNLFINLASPATYDFAVADEGSDIQRVSADGTRTAPICTGAACHAQDIAADANGVIYAHDNQGIAKITPAGAVTQLLNFSDNPIFGDNAGTGGIALDGLGNIIFVDNSLDAVFRVATDGTGLVQVAAFPLASPDEQQDTYVALDQSGNYVVTSDDNETTKVYRFTPSGAVTTLGTFEGRGTSGVAVDASGNVIFTDNWNAQVVSVDSTGALTVVAQVNCCSTVGLTLDPATGNFITGSYGGALLRVTASSAVTTIVNGSPLTLPVSVTPIPLLTTGPLTVTPSSLSGGVVGQSYGPYTMSATGGSGFYTWSATGLPSGVTITAAGVVSGMLTTSGNFTAQITATDSLTAQTGSANIGIAVMNAPLIITGGATVFNLALGTPLNTTYTAAGGVMPYSWNWTGLLPPGLTLSSTGVLNGVITQAGNYSFRVQVNDIEPVSTGETVTVSVLGLTSTSLPGATATAPYSATVGATGGVGPYTFRGSGFPSGLSISGTGVVSGKTTLAGPFSVSITVTDSTDLSAVSSLSLTVSPSPVSVTTSSLPNPAVGIPYSQALSATGGAQPYTWTRIGGALPLGLSLSPAGTISGNPTQGGSVSLTVQATDNNGASGTANLTLTVYSPLNIIPTTLPSGAVGQNYGPITALAAGGSGNVTWSSTGLPAGVSLGAATGVISGRPTAGGPFNAMVTATDTLTGQTGSQTYTGNIAYAALTITSSGNIGAVPVGGAVSATFAAIGGKPPYTWSSAGTPPAGVTLNAAGALTGTVTQAGNYTFIAQVTDAQPVTTPLTVTGSALGITTTSLPAAAATALYSAPVTALGGATPYVFTGTGFPAGLSILSGTGVITGRATVTGPASLSITVTDANQIASTSTLPLMVGPSPVSVSTSSLPNAAVGIPYSQSLTAAGGASPYTWILTGPALPNGLSLSASGIVSGNPTVNGSFSFTPKATDSNGASGTGAVSLTVLRAVTITSPASLPAGMVNQAFGPVTLVATGGSGSITWSSTGLPAGLSIDASSGIISGTPTAGGPYSATVTATDTVTGQTGSRNYSGSISYAPLTITTSGNLGVVGLSTSLGTTFAATGGKPPYTWASTGTLPTGAALNAAGMLTGTVTQAGNYIFTAQVTDAQPVTTPLTVTGSVLGLTTTSLTPATATAPYSATVVAAGGSTPYTFTGTGFPTGLSISSAGVITGTTTVTGSASVAITVTDANRVSSTSTLSLLVNPSPVSVSTSSLPNAAVGIPYSQTVTAAGGAIPYTWTMPGGALPNGLSLSSAGIVSGNPTASGPFSFPAKATDGNGASGTATVSITVLKAVTITIPESLPSGAVGQNYGPVTVVATGGSGSVTWSSTGLPAGVSIDATSGIVSGTPTAAGPYSATVMATDTVTGQTGSRNYSGSISYAALTITSSGNLGVTALGTSLAATFAAAGGKPPYTWASTGTLPAGAALSATGALTGTVTQAGNYTFTAQVTDAQPVTTPLTVTGSVLGIVTTSLPPATATTAYSATVSAAGGATPYTFTGTGFPSGLSISAAGLITGTTAVTGPASAAITVTDANRISATAMLSLTVGASLTISTTALPAATQGVAYSQTIGATGGTGPYTWTVTQGTVTNAGLALDSTGALTGTPVTADTLTFTAQVADSAGATASQTLGLYINLPSPATYDFAVSDGATSIQRVSADGTRTSTICSGPTCHVRDIVADSLGVVYAHDNQGIARITPAGAVTQVLSFSDNPIFGARAGVGGIALDGLGNIIFVDNVLDVVFRVATDGTGLTQVAAFPVQSSDESQDTYVTLDHAGNYVVVSDDNNTVKIYSFTPAGVATTLGTFPERGSTGVVVDAAGNIVFTDYKGSQLVSVDAGGNPTVLAQGSSLCCQLVGMTLDPGTGNYIAGLAHSADALLRITQGGAVTSIVNGSPLTSPTSMAAIPLLSTSPLTVSPSSLSDGMVGQSYGPFTMSAAGGTGFNAWTATGLPPGVTIGSAGVVSGTPTASGSFTMQIVATDALTAQTGSVNIAISIAPILPLTITSGMTGFGTIPLGNPIATTYTAAGGLTPYNWNWTGSLPPGVTLTPAGVLSGTISQPGPYSFKVQVNDIEPVSTAATVTVSVLGLTTASLSSAVATAPYSATVVAAGGATPYTFTGTGFPAGLSISTAGIVTGTTTVTGPASVAITVTDANKVASTSTLSLTVSPSPVSVSTSSLPNAAVGISYSQTLSVSGGASPYTWTMTGGALPAGLGLNAGGLVSGNPTASGPFSFTAKATDNNGASGTATVSITVLKAVTVTSPASLSAGTIAQTFGPVTAVASGGSGTFAWSSTGLPAGLSIDAGSGIISGTPTAGGPYSATVTATDKVTGQTGSQTYSGSIAYAALTITSSGNPGVVPLGSSFATTFAATGGKPPYTWAGTGTLPAGAALGAGGALTGTATQAGNYTFTAQVTDAQPVTTPLTVTGSVLGLTTTSLPAAVATVSYSATVSAAGGATPYTFTGTGFPAGLSISAAGAITGTTTATAPASLSITVTDTNKISATSALSLAVTTSPVTISTSSLPNAAAGIPYSQTLTASGGSQPYAWTLTNGALPAGLTFSTAGAIAGSPTASGPFSLTFKATDTTGASGTAMLSLTVAPIVTIVLPALPGASINQGYGPVVVTATGGSGTTYTWTASGLPGGIAIGPTTGSIGGTPAVSGSFSGTITATDAITHQTATQAFTFSVTGFPALSISSAGSPAPVALGGAVSGTFTGSGGKPPYTWSSSGLPANVTLSSDGVLSGAPSQAGVFTASVTVTDSQPSSVSTGVTINVFGLTSASLPAGLVGQFYSASVGATGGAAPYSFSATGLPPGLSLSAAGNLTGTVAAPNTYNFTVKATDNGGLSVSAGFSLTIGKPQAISVSGGALADGAVNTPYSQSLSASGGVAPYTWALSAGVLPPGLSLSSSGTLSGIPTTPGPFSFGAMATDGAGAIATAAVSLTVQAAPLVISTQNVPSGVNGLGYPQQVLGASGGVLPYTWTVTAGSLPAGITLSSAGLLAGTPISAGSFPVSVTATDKAGTTGTVNLALTVRPPAADLILSSGSLSFALMTPSTVTPPTQMAGVQSTRSDQQIQYTVSVSPAASWLTVTSGSTTPDTLQVAISAAALTLTPGDYTTTIAVKCGTAGCAGNTQSISVDLTVTASPPRLQVQTDLLSFGAMTSSLQAMTQSIAIQNAGGGSLGIGSVSCEAAWCTAGSAPASLPGGASGSIQVSINPALLTAGFFRTQVDIATSAGTASVPVTVLVAADSTMTLAPVGTQFSMQTGSAPGNASGSFLVSVTNVAAVSWSASLLSGSPWLTLTSAPGASSASAPGAVNYVIDPAGAAALPPGVYYGQIGVSSSAIVNSPQTFEVVLSVSPVNVSVIPDPEPAGLLFITSVGGTLPPQTVTVYSGSTLASGFQASATTTSGGAWLSVTPSLGSAASGSPGVTSVTVNTAGLKQGVYTGGVSYSLSATAVRVVNVALIVTPPGTVTGSQVSSGAAPRGLSPKDSGTCTPSVLVPLQTGLVNNFSAAVAWPTPLTVVLANDCGSLIKSGQLVATFSNGDPPLPLALADPSKGLYSGTWTPRNSVAQMTVIAHASAAGYPEASVQVVGAATPNSAPLLTPHGTLHSFDPLIGAALAPGTIIQIYGQNLASQTAQPTTIPLPTTMNGTSVIIGGIPAPLYYVSAGQINAQLPFELTPGNQYQVLISANGALTTPDVVQLSAATPGLAAFADSTLIAQHGDGTLVSATAPAKPGEYLVAYLAGMGETTATPVSGTASPGSPLALPSLPPVLTLNGAVYPIAFAGLTPGLVGLYQMNFQVPAGLPAGNLTLVVNQNGALSNQTVLPYAP